MDLLGTNAATQPTHNGRERVRKWAVGERWTPEMRDAQQAAIRELAHARKRFADYARARLGLPEVDLFSQVEQPDKQDPATLVSGNGASAPTPAKFLLTAAKVSSWKVRGTSADPVLAMTLARLIVRPLIVLYARSIRGASS